MTSRLYHDWPGYILLVGVVFFIIYVIIKGNQQEKIKEDEILNKDKKKSEK